MKRVLLLSLLAVFGCKKEASGPTPEAIDQAAALKPLAVAPVVDAGSAHHDDDDEDVDERRDDEDDLLPKPKEEAKARKITPKSELRKVTEQDLQKFIAWQKTTSDLTEAAKKEFQTKTNSIRKAGGLQQQVALSQAMAQFAARKDEVDKRAQEASGLDPKDAVWLRSFVWDVLGNQRIVEESGLEKTIAQAEQNMRNMNPEQRADAQQDLDKLKETLGNMVSLRDPRDEYGDENVDLVLKHEAELMPLYKKAVDEMGK